MSKPLLPLDNNDQLMQVPFVAETAPEIVTTGNSSSIFDVNNTVIVRVKNIGTVRGYISVGTSPTALTTSFSLEANQDIFTGIRPGKKINVVSSTFEISTCGGGD